MQEARIGVFGGSFSPPHLGHLRAAEFFAASCRLRRVLVFPAGASPLKARAADISDGDRLALCRLTFAGEPFEVCDWELTRPGPSYTVDTLRHVRAVYPGARLFLLIGEDQRAQFPLWKDWRAVLELAELFVLPRWESGAGFTPLPVSSTRIRAKLAQGEDVSAYLAPEALDYIYRKRLYDATGLP